MDINNYLAALNEEQLQAVKDEGQYTLVLDDPSAGMTLKEAGSGRILAGAGSGKTRVVTTKIAYLISKKNVLPYKILALTFTKKAANEMRQRAIQIEPRAERTEIRTFHSWGSYFLRKYAEFAGINKDFTVYDDDDMVTLVTKAIPSLPRKEAAEVAHRISLAKDYGITPETTDFSVLHNTGLDILKSDVFLEQYATYQKRLRSTGNVDFGDLILLPIHTLKTNEYLRQEMHRHYQIILVDEFQDSNVAQLILLKQLAGIEENPPARVCVFAVGDEDQSIYKFRGAEIQNIINFENLFIKTNTYHLIKNYRSTPEILACANSLIKYNTLRTNKKKSLVATHQAGKKPTLVFLPSQEDETQFCAELIQNAHKRGVPYSDWAILYRTNAQSLGFENDFLRRKIPYTIIGSLKFYEREEVKDTLAWLSFLVNQKDEISFRRIINKPARGIGATSQDKIVEASLGSSLLEGCTKIKLSKKSAEGAKAFTEAAEQLLSMIPEESEEKKNTSEKLSSFIEEVIKKSGLEEYHKAQDEVSGTQKLMNLQELVNGAVLYPCTKEGLINYLDSIELDRSLEEKSDDAATDTVTLITLHNTKGLEFPRVIITGMEYGVFPRENKTGSELEEERRLFYVGITRAEQELYFTSCNIRRLYGRTNYMQPSPFLSELGKDNVRILGNKPNLYNPESTGSAEHPLSKKWCRGSFVYHDDYGQGQITKAYLSDEGEWVINVSFETGETKKFLPQYQSSSLTILGD